MYRVHNSTVSRQLRYALTKERLCCMAVTPAAYAPYFYSPMLCKLAIVEICIKSVRCKQALMIALLYNLSVFHNKDNIRFPDGRQTMSHYKACPALHHSKERFVNLNLCTCINR